MSATAKQSIKLKKLSKHNTTWHPESTLVFKSPGTGKDKVVIGRWIDDELIPLDEEAVTLCETWAFTPDPDLMGESEEEEGEGEDGEPDPEPLEEEWGGATESDSEKGKEEVKEQVKEEVKEEVKSKTIATNFSSEVERLTQALSKEIIPIVTKLEQELASTKEQLESKTEECKDYKQKFESINQKFEAMKSIFSPN